MKAQITKPFFHQNNWFFAGDTVEGKTAEAAVSAGAADTATTSKGASGRKKKDAGAAPENKMMEKPDGDV